jgi:hypothetical protein
MPQWEHIACAVLVLSEKLPDKIGTHASMSDVAVLGDSGNIVQG